jgi:hypothetical protein
VTNWLEEAKKPHIQEIHLTLPFYTLKHVIFVSQTLVVLKLESLYVGKDTSSVHLPSLKTLNLTSVSFQNRDDYINFLYACPILEDLHAENRDGLFNGINNVKFLPVDMECTKVVSLRAIPLFPNLISIKLVFPSYSHICWDGLVELLRHCPKLQILFIKKVFSFACSFFSIYFDKCYLIDHYGVIRSMHNVAKLT